MAYEQSIHRAPAAPYQPWQRARTVLFGRDIYHVPNATLVIAALLFYVTALVQGLSLETIDWNTRLAVMILVAGYFVPGYGPGAVRVFAVVALWLGWTMQYVMFTIVTNLTLSLIGPLLVRARVLHEVTIMPFAIFALFVVLAPWHLLV
jgi:Flp pilus assembly protein protease CpaA